MVEGFWGLTFFWMFGSELFVLSEVDRSDFAGIGGVDAMSA